MENAEEKSDEQLCKELLESINRQVDINTRLKEILEPVAASSTGSESLGLSEEITNEIKDLVIEAESLQAKEKAGFYQLLRVDTEAQ